MSILIKQSFDLDKKTTNIEPDPTLEVDLDLVNPSLAKIKNHKNQLKIHQFDPIDTMGQTKTQSTQSKLDFTFKKSKLMLF